MVFWHFVICFVSKNKNIWWTFSYESLFNSRYKIQHKSFKCLNIDDIAISDKSFSNRIILEQEGGHFLDLKPDLYYLKVVTIFWW